MQFLKLYTLINILLSNRITLFDTKKLCSIYKKFKDEKKCK